MRLYDLYLDKDINGYVVFKTLSKRKVIEAIQYRYKGSLDIQESQLHQLGDCLVLDIQGNYFEDYIQLYKDIMLVGDMSSKIENEVFQVSLEVPLTRVMYVRLNAVIIGTNKMAQSFMIRSNIRNGIHGLDIYFGNGNCYFYCGEEATLLDEEHLYHKYIKKYNIED